MAWKVDGYMEGRDGNARFQSRESTVYGPLPRKRWVRDVPFKKHRLSAKPSRNVDKVGTVKEYTASRAVLYAEWLAARDGLVLPDDCKIDLCWSAVVVSDKSKPEPRVYAVIWDHHDYDRRTGQTTITRKLTVPIPNWDWVPQMTESDAIPPPPY